MKIMLDPGSFAEWLKGLLTTSRPRNFTVTNTEKRAFARTDMGMDLMTTVKPQREPNLTFHEDL